MINERMMVSEDRNTGERIKLRYLDTGAAVIYERDGRTPGTGVRGAMLVKPFSDARPMITTAGGILGRPDLADQLLAAIE